MNPPIHWLGAIIGVLTLSAGVMVVTARKPIHAACFLILTLFGVAAEYVVLEAQTIAVFQILVYAGAIVVLIAFVLMLVGSGPADDEPVDIIGNWRALVGLGLSFALMVVFGYGLSIDRTSVAEHAVDPTRFGQLEGLGQALLNGYVCPFEIISLLLMVAIVGTVALLRKAPPREKEEAEQ